MKEQVIEELRSFRKQLTEITDDDTKNDRFCYYRTLAESYELFECAGNWIQEKFVTMFVQTKNTKKTFIFGTCYDNPSVFEELMKELVG